MNTNFVTESAIKLPNLIKQMGNSLIGCELGVWYGRNSGYLLQECSNIKLLYGIDPYLPYQDWNRYITEEDINSIKREALQSLSVFNDRFKLIEKPADQARHLIDDYSLDFIFIDGDHSFEMCYSDINNYYNKVRRGGLFSGHDFTLPGVNKALAKFRKENNLKNNFKVIQNDVWYWIKD